MNDRSYLSPDGVQSVVKLFELIRQSYADQYEKQIHEVPGEGAQDVDELHY